jgi:hypothetical protein
MARIRANFPLNVRPHLFTTRRRQKSWAVPHGRVRGTICGEMMYFVPAATTGSGMHCHFTGYAMRGLHCSRSGLGFRFSRELTL